MGMIRVSDHAEQIIKDFASERGITNTSAVDVLLASDTNTAAIPSDSSINKRLDDLAVYLEKKFAEIKELVEDTSVDRLASGGGRRTRSTKYLDWPIVQELMFDWAEDADWSCAAAKKGMEESNLADEAKWYIDENNQGVWGEFYGEKQKYLNLTPHVLSFLNEKGIVL